MKRDEILHICFCVSCEQNSASEGRILKIKKNKITVYYGFHILRLGPRLGEEAIVLLLCNEIVGIQTCIHFEKLRNDIYEMIFLF